MRYSLVFSLCLTLAGGARAQLRPFGDVHAIVGARIEIGDGRVIEKGTVLIRDGLIEALGPDLAVPPDAEVLKGDGLTVFPGFVDAFLTKGLKLPDSQPNQDVPPDTGSEAPASMRTANRKGVRPELRAADFFVLTEADLTPIRKAGFTTALVSPSGATINGVAALVNLSGLPKRECIVRSAVTMDFAFHTPTEGRSFGGGSGYPGTLLGIFAHIRQTLMDARYYRLLKTAFENGGPRRPPADESLAALLPALDGAMPVLFEADAENDVDRAVRLADEFGLRPILCGGLEAWKHAPLLVKHQVPVLLSLDFGDEPKLPGQKPPQETKQDAKEEKKEAKPAPGEKPPTTPATKPEDKKEEDEDEFMPEAARKERHRKWEEKVANAGQLNKAGVLFAFTTKGVKDTTTFWENLRRAVKEGLPREAALKALTLNPAKIFGVERQMGTIEAGKIADLVVMQGDFSDAKAKVKFVFVDGKKFDVERESPPAPARPPGSPMEGDDRLGRGDR